MTSVTTPASAATTTTTDQFIQGIGPAAAISLVVGSMIGSGIFIVSADIGRQVGAWGPGGLMLVWVLTGLMTMAGALSYAELAAMLPKAGGQYVFLRDGLSKSMGFLYGWTLFMVIQTGTIAAVGVAFAKFLAVLVPALYILAIAFLLVVLLVDPDKRKFSAFGLMIVALGLPVYFLWHRRGHGGV